LTILWMPPSPYRRREIIQGEGERSSTVRPMRVRARAAFVEALGNAHRWLDELTHSDRTTLETLTAREGKTERSIRMTLSLASAKLLGRLAIVALVDAACRDERARPCHQE
jgi:site-specific DNA recombinase